MGNIWNVTPVTSMTDSDYFYIGKYDDVTPTLNKILKADVMASINSMISSVSSSIPTKTSDLTNDAGFLTETELPDLSNYIQASDLTGYALKSEIPTTTSQLTNNSGFLTSHQDLSDYVTHSELSDIVVTTDTTLSMSGVPADSAAVGEALDNISITIDTDGAGQPVPITDSADMDDTSVMYLYLGDETGYEYGTVYCYVNDEWLPSIHAYGTIAMAGAVFSDDAIDLLETILNAGTYSTSQTANINALIAELRDSF